MFFKFRKLVATLLVISIVFTSSAFNVFSEGIDNVTSQSTESSVEISEEQTTEELEKTKKIVATDSETKEDEEDGLIDPASIEEKEDDQTTASEETSKVDRNQSSDDIATNSNVENIVDEEPLEESNNDVATTSEISDDTHSKELLATKSNLDKNDSKLFGDSYRTIRLVTAEDERVLYHNEPQEKLNEMLAFIDSHTYVCGWYHFTYSTEQYDPDKFEIDIDSDYLKTSISNWYNSDNSSVQDYVYGLVYWKCDITIANGGYYELPSTGNWEYVGSKSVGYQTILNLKPDGSGQFLESLELYGVQLVIKNENDDKKKSVGWLNGDTDNFLPFGTVITSKTDLQFEPSSASDSRKFNTIIRPKWIDLTNQKFYIAYVNSGVKIIDSLDPLTEKVDCDRVLEYIYTTKIKGYYLIQDSGIVDEIDVKTNYNIRHDSELSISNMQKVFDDWYFNPAASIVYGGCYQETNYTIIYDGNYTSLSAEDYDSTSSGNYEIDNIISQANSSNTIQISETQDFEENHKILKIADDNYIYLNSSDCKMPTCIVKEWNTKPDGTGITYGFDERIERRMFDINYQLKLYAIYESAKWNASYSSSDSTTLKTKYEVNECFNPDGLAISYGKDIFYYSAKMKNLVEFSPTLETPLKDTDNRIVVNFKKIKTPVFNDTASFFIPISVGSLYNIKYTENHPTGSWTIPSSRISDNYDWATDLSASSTTMNTAGTAFATAMSVKGNARWMIQKSGTTEPTWKKLKEWNTKADGTGTRYTIGQSITAPNSDFAGKTLTLYAVWEDIPITKFRICYKDGTNKEVDTVFSYDLTTYIDTVLSNIPTGYDAFYIVSHNSSNDDDVVKTSYDPSTNGTLTKEQIKTNYNSWITAGASTNPVYGATYKEKHFYLAYTPDGTNKAVEEEMGWSNNVDEVVGRIDYAKLLGWYEIVPTGEYSIMSIDQLYNPSTTTNLKTTDEVKTSFAGWNTNRVRNYAYGASVSPISSIAVKTGTTLKTSYIVNEALNVDNLIIVPTYADGTDGAEVPYAGNEIEIEITPAVGTALTLAHNNTNVTVKYGPAGAKKTCTYTITVTEKQIDSIAVKDGLIAGGTLKTNYIEGQKLDPTNLEITVTYDDATTADIPYAGNESSYAFSIGGSTRTISTYELSTSDAGDVTITYAGKTCTYPITVAAKVATGIEIKTGTSLKTNYYVNDKLNVSGLVIKYKYDNGKHDEITYTGHETLFEFTPALTATLSEADNVVEVKYDNNFTASYNIKVTVYVPTPTPAPYVPSSNNPSSNNPSSGGNGRSSITSSGNVIQNGLINNSYSVNNNNPLFKTLENLQLLFQQKIINAPVNYQPFVISRTLNTNTKYNWEKINNNWRMKNESDSTYYKGWALIEYNGNLDWFHFDENCNMTTGWYFEGNTAYFFEMGNEAFGGRLLTGEQVINGIRFLFGPNGKFLGMK